MATSSGGTSDEVIAELNPDRELVEDPGPGLRRPAEPAEEADWVDYVVALGASRDLVTGKSKHWDDAAEAYLPAKALSKDDLVQLAERLGG